MDVDYVLLALRVPNLEILLAIKPLVEAGWYAVTIGIIFIGVAIAALLGIIPLVARHRDASIGILAHRAMVNLIIGGFVVLILGLVFLMGAFPWWNS
jgi:hypothetical protein